MGGSYTLINKILSHMPHSVLVQNNLYYFVYIKVLRIKIKSFISIEKIEILQTENTLDNIEQEETVIKRSL